MSSLTVQDISLRELLSFVFKYRRRLGLAFAVPCLAGILLSFVPVPRYHATSVLIVRLGSEYVYQPEVGTNASGQTPTIPFDQEQIFKSEVAILNSSDLHTQVIDTIGLETIYPELTRRGFLAPVMAPFRAVIDTVLETAGLYTPPTETEEKAARLTAAAAVFNRRFDIFLQKESAVIEVSFEHKNAAVAVRALEVLLQLYFEKRKQLYLVPRVNLAQTQLETAHARVTAAEQAVKDFKHKHQIYSFMEQRASLLEQRNDVEQQLGVLDSRQAELASLLAALSNSGGGKQKDVVLYDRGGGDLAMTNARIRLIDAESRLKDALTNYTKDSPVVAAAQAQMRDARAVLGHAELDRGRAEAEMGSNQIRRDSLGSSIAAVNRKLDQLDALERDFNSLTREVKIAEDSYALFSRQLDEARAFEKLQHDRADSVRVIQPPAAPPTPAKIQAMIVFGGLFMGILCVLAVAAVIEFFRSGFYTPERLENKLGLPVLATIPLCE